MTKAQKQKRMDHILLEFIRFSRAITSMCEVSIFIKEQESALALRLKSPITTDFLNSIKGLDEDPLVKSIKGQRLVAPFKKCTIAQEAAIVVLGHSMFESVVNDLLQFSFFLGDKNWEESIGNKRIKYSEIKGKKNAEIRDLLFTSCWGEYSKGDLETRVAILLGIIRYERWKEKTYDVEALKKFDAARHSIVHSDGMTRSPEVTSEDVKGFVWVALNFIRCFCKRFRLGRFESRFKFISLLVDSDMDKHLKAILSSK